MTTTPTWNNYKARSKTILAELLATAVYLMEAPAEEEIDTEVEIDAEDAYTLLGDLSDAWNAINKNGSDLTTLALAVWKNEMTVDEAIGF